MVLKNEFIVFLVAMSPVFELRGAIPLGLARGLSVAEVFILSWIGNILVIVPLLIFFRWAEQRLEHLKGIGKLLRWWFSRVDRKSQLVQTYGLLGLVLFVAIPLPGTGAWTGSVAATLFKFKISKAFIAIMIGVTIAAILVTLASMGAFKLWFKFT